MGHELTKKDMQEMEEEMEYRKLVLRKQLLEDVKTAREQGDLSENFEYYAAKKAKNQNESRIRYLDRMLRTAEVFEDNSKEDEVGMNSKVTVFIPEDNTEEVYTVVTTMKSDSLTGNVSIESPMGKALLHKKVGDTVQIRVNENYAYEIVIRKIEKEKNSNVEAVQI